MKNREWKQGPESNRRRADYGSAVLPLNYPAVGLSRVSPLLLTNAGLITRANLSEANCCASDQILLLLREPFGPLGNPATGKTHSAGQRCCVAKYGNCVFLFHGGECLAHKTKWRQVR